MWVEGISLIVVGFFYLLKPGFFQTLLWPRIPIRYRLLSAEQNEQLHRDTG